MNETEDLSPTTTITSATVPAPAPEVTESSSTTDTKLLDTASSVPVSSDEIQISAPHFETVDNEIKPVTTTETTAISISTPPLTTVDNLTTTPIISDEYSKVNGDHESSSPERCHQSFLDCNEESCASTASSSSSHNLIIDHPEDSQEENDKKNLQKIIKEKEEATEEVNSLSPNDENHTHEEKYEIQINTAKRKLSIDCDENIEEYLLPNQKIVRLEDDDRNDWSFVESEKNNAAKLNEVRDGSILEAALKATTNFLHTESYISHISNELLNTTTTHRRKTVKEDMKNNLGSIKPCAESYQQITSSVTQEDNSKMVENEENNACMSITDNTNMTSIKNATKDHTSEELQQEKEQETNKKSVVKEHFQEYAQYLGLKPSIKFKCHKCLNNSYDTLTELRDHQKLCFFKKTTSFSNTKIRNASNSNSNDDFTNSNSNYTGEIFRNAPSLNSKFSISNSNQTTSTNANVIESTSSTSSNLQNEKDSDRTGLPLNDQIMNNLTKSFSEAKKKVFLCSACGTYYENWNLFLHMREVHKKYVCLYCIGMFPSAERLTLHLEMKHDLEQNHFESQEKLLRSSRDTCYLMCCICEYMFTEHEDFSNHNCNELIRPCHLCGEKGKHNSDCKASQALKSSKQKGRLKRKQNKLSNIASNNDNNNTLLSILHGKNKLDGNDIEFESENRIQNGREKDQPTNATITNTTATTNTNIICDNFKGSSKQQNSLFVKLNGCATDTLVMPPAVEVATANVTQTKQHSSSFSSPPQSSPPPVTNNTMPTDFNTNSYIGMSKAMNHQQQQLIVGNLESCHNNYEMSTAATTDTKTMMTANINNSLEVDQHNYNNTINQQSFVDDSMNNNNNNNNNNQIHGKDINKTNIYKDISDITVQEQYQKQIMDTSELPVTEERSLNEHNLCINDENAESAVVENNVEEKRLFVPKFKLKIPKNFQASTVMDSDQSTSESEYDDDENEDDEGGDNDENHESEQEENKTYGEFANQNNQNISNESDEVTQGEKLSIQDDSNGEATYSQSTFDEKGTVSTEALNEKDSTNNETMIQQRLDESVVNEQAAEMPAKLMDSSIPVENKKQEPEDGIEVADDNIPIIELSLSQPLDKLQMLEFLRICLRATYPFCLYCNHARRIAVSGHGFALHLLAQHRFSATVDSITAEELKPSTIVAKLKSLLPELSEYYFNLETYCNLNKENLIPCYERIFECFQCRFETRIHKELYLHNRKMHLKTAILCFMCKSNFFNYSEILCHMCPGEPNKFVIFDIQFRCCLCDLDRIPSAFRLMVHLRKAHFACDVCLEDCQNQSKLSSHVWKHKLHHLCYRCGIAYRNKSDITKHLFWKHGTESVLCKRCQQKRWPHVYHFCIPPSLFVCEVCNLTFSRSMYLKVHKRLHSGDAPYPCTEDNCDQKFISRKLLLKHVAKHTEEIEQKTATIKSPGKSEIDETKYESDKMEVKKIENDDSSNADNNKKSGNEENLPLKDEGGDAVGGSGEGTKSKKKKRSKKENNKMNIDDDIMNLPAPNLSESDSSDDEPQQQLKREENLTKSLNLSPPLSSLDNVADVPKAMLSPLSNAGDDDENSKDATQINHTPVIDIWENFKAFQASQASKKYKEENCDDENSVPITPILHVSQSDHDYCMIYYKTVLGKNEENEYKLTGDKLVEEEESDKEKPQISDNSLPEENKRERRDTAKSEKIVTDSSSTPSPRKKQKSSQQKMKSGSESSSGSSSSSDTSCSCGSNCSCCDSSSSSSGSSSSSEDSDSSTSEGRRRIAAKRAAKEEKRKRNKSENSSKANNSDIVDVVTTDGNPVLEPPNFEPFIQESDLETDESDTDEDFYDEHPQKLATQLLAEKRKQLMMQTCMSPSHNFDIVENSRPSTPSLPEEMLKEKKVKIKKRKRERKTPKHNSLVATPTPFSLNIPNNDLSANLQLNNIQTPKETTLPATETIPTALLGPPTAPMDITSQSTLNSLSVSTPIAAPVKGIQSRLSTGSNSDAEAPLKRSKRARRPNKFYGYSSDDEGASSSNYLTGPAAFKPIPPPNFTWRKEDLPSPQSKSKSSKSNYSRKNSTSSTPSTPGTPTTNTPPVLPPIPPIIIRPGLINSPKPPVIEHNTPLVEPLRIPIPPVPVHHIQPPQIYSLSRESQESDSSDEDRLHIPITTSSRLSGKKTSKDSKTTAARQKQQKQQRQKQQQQKQQQQQQSMIQIQPQFQQLPPPTPVIAAPSVPTPIPPAPPRERKIPPALLQTPPDFARIQYFRSNNIRYPIRPPIGARPAREGESIYCYCRCPYDEVSEMIACDGENCLIEWFHFECVGILVPPKGKWFCPECRLLYPNEQMDSHENKESINHNLMSALMSGTISGTSIDDFDNLMSS